MKPQSLEPQSLPGLRLFCWEIVVNLQMVLALLVILFLVVRSLLLRDRAAASNINLEDLLLGEDGRISKKACVMFGAFILTSWVVIYQTVSGELSDWLFAAYIAAWVAPTVSELLAGKGAAA